MLNAVMLIVVILNVVMLNVVAQSYKTFYSSLKVGAK